MRFRADFVAVATKIGYSIAYICRIVNPVKQILNNYLLAFAAAFMMLFFKGLRHYYN